jgi:glycosyltransferase involved in cell wall biosynthesis
MHNSSIQVAIFAPDMAVGGAERSMLNLAAGLTGRGHAVDLVLARAQGPFLVDVPRTVRVVDLKARRVLASLVPLVRYLRRERPAALLSVLHANIIAIWARRLSGVPVRLIVSERNTLSSEVQGYGRDLRVRLMPHLVKRFYPGADCVVAVSEGVADDLVRIAEIPREHIRVIYNPIVTPQLREKAQATIIHPWFAPDEPPVVLGVGRLSVQKDFVTLIRAFQAVHLTRPARLLILGDGEERPALQALVEQLDLVQDVSLPGVVANPCPYMTRAGVFVLSSRWEGLPGVLIEALYCGSPLVATDCPSGPREILAHGRYGQLVPVGDVPALGRAIEATLDGRNPRPPRESWQRFEQETVVDQYARLLIDGCSGDHGVHSGSCQADRHREVQHRIISCSSTNPTALAVKLTRCR